MKALQIGGFFVGAMLVAWLGAFADTFILPMDEVSARALGSPEVAYAPIRGMRVLVAAGGTLIFAVAVALARAGTVPARRALSQAATWGAFYSASLVVLLHVATWFNTAVGAVALWAATILVPVGAAWMCARCSLPNNEVQRTRPAQAMEPRR